MMNKDSKKLIIISILLAEGVGLLSGWLSGNLGGDYKMLVQPPFAPPGWLFPVAWAILYALMGAAAALIPTSMGADADKKRALILYGLQLLVNFSWSIFFFRFDLLWFSVAVILLLLLLVVLTFLAFLDLRPLSGYLLIPYILWLLFATYLNISVALLN